MCVVSMIADHYNDKWQSLPYKDLQKIPKGKITAEAFWTLKKEVEEMKVLLQKAKLYDQINDQEDCETESKIAPLKTIADLVNVDIIPLFKKP